MYMSLGIAFAYAITAIHACNPGTNGCDHPGNFTGAVTTLTDPAVAYCNPGTATGLYASIPISFYDPPDESPCDSPITVTNPITKKTINVTVIGKCTACAGDAIQLTTGALAALARNGRAGGAPATVDWTFVG